MDTMTIREFDLDRRDDQIVYLPGPDIRVLAARMCMERLTLLAVVRKDGENQPVNIRMARTGAPFDGDGYTYLATVEDSLGDLHVFHQL